MIGLYVTTFNFPELSYYVLMQFTFQMLLHRYMKSVGKVLPLPHILDVIERLLVYLQQRLLYYWKFNSHKQFVIAFVK